MIIEDKHKNINIFDVLGMRIYEKIIAYISNHSNN